VTHLRKIMLEELQRRHYFEGTTRYYIRHVERFARHFNCSPDRLRGDSLCESASVGKGPALIDLRELLLDGCENFFLVFQDFCQCGLVLSDCALVGEDQLLIFDDGVLVSENRFLIFYDGRLVGQDRLLIGQNFGFGHIFLSPVVCAD